MNLKTDQGVTALMLALMYKHDTIAKYFIKTKKADLTQVDNYRWSALHYAVCCSSVEVVKFLLYYGIDTELRNNNGVTAQDMAIEHNRMDILTLLLQQHNDSNFNYN